MGQLGEFPSELEGDVQRLTRSSDAIDEADPLCLRAVDAASGQEQVHRSAVSYQTRKVNGAAVDKGHTETPAEHPEYGVGCGDPQIAPQGELESAGDGRSFDGGDHRLGEWQARRTHRSRTVVGDRATIAGEQGVEVRTSTESATGAGQHGDRERVIGIEIDERGEEGGGGHRVDRIAALRSIDGDDANGPIVDDEHSVCCSGPRRAQKRQPAGLSYDQYRTVIGQTARNMQRMACPTCGNEVFFDSMRCVVSGTDLVFDVGVDGAVTIGDAAVVGTCLMRDTWRCNWRPQANGICASCLIVDAGDHSNNTLLVPFLVAQRRALAQLSVLGIDWSPNARDGTVPPPLVFTYRSTGAGDPATIGHLDGLITLDLDEADPAQREHIRATLGEPYRTPLGHIRHELGHYVWLRFVASDPARLSEFGDVFGDVPADYRQALDDHYARDDDGSWRDEYVSFYAAAHPWEDFAESWAQVMHVHDVVSTGSAWGVVDAPVGPFDPAQWMSTAVVATLAANELARAMGMRDLYPFQLSPGARRKIEAAWRLSRPLRSA